MLAVKAQHQTDGNRNDESNDSQKIPNRALAAAKCATTRASSSSSYSSSSSSLRCCDERFGLPWGKNYHENLLFYHTSVTVPLMTNSATPFRVRSFSLVESFHPTGNYTTVFTFHSRKND
jgi:hypothetical protein